jgi:hypothetical protein
MLISKFMYIRDCKIKEADRVPIGIISRAEVSSTNFVRRCQLDSKLCHDHKKYYSEFSSLGYSFLQSLPLGKDTSNSNSLPTIE